MGMVSLTGWRREVHLLRTVHWWVGTGQVTVRCVILRGRQAFMVCMMMRPVAVPVMVVPILMGLVGVVLAHCLR
jgi:hypothetical protein